MSARIRDDLSEVQAKMEALVDGIADRKFRNFKDLFGFASWRDKAVELAVQKTYELGERNGSYIELNSATVGEVKSAVQKHLGAFDVRAARLAVGNVAEEHPQGHSSDVVLNAALKLPESLTYNPEIWASAARWSGVGISFFGGIAGLAMGLFLAKIILQIVVESEPPTSGLFLSVLLVDAISFMGAVICTAVKAYSKDKCDAAGWEIANMRGIARRR